MLKRFLLASLVSLPVFTKAQFLSEPSIGIGAGIMNFSPQWLDNRTNANSKKSVISEYNYHQPLSKVFALNVGLGFGNIRNMGTEFEPLKGSDLYRLKAALFLQIPIDTRIQPFFRVGYNFDYIRDNSDGGYSSVSSNMNFGAGGLVKIKDHVGLLYHFTVNQRVGQDYRTFTQHTIGISVAWPKREIHKFKPLKQPEF